VVNALNSRTWGRSHAGMVYAQIHPAAQTIHDLQIQKIPRRTLSSGVMYSAPACVLDIVENDCNLDISD
jgi:hypothetical protein